jgi:predicted ester cyclase
VHERLVYNGEEWSRERYRERLADDVRTIPDLHYDAELLVVGAEQVACRIRFDCTPRGPFLGIDAGGRRVTFAEHVFYRFRAGRIEEVWSLIDTDGIRRQLEANNSDMSAYEHHAEVDAYIAALPGWQATLCRELRDLIHAAIPSVTETIKRRVRPYFVHHGNVCALLATKDHINLFLYDGAIVPDPDGIITGGHDNTTARTVAFWEGDAVPREPLTVMLRQIAANNEAGGWRALKK